MREAEFDGNYPSESGAVPSPTGGARHARFGAGDGLWLVLVFVEGVVSWAAYWMVVLSNFSYDACAGYPRGTCDYSVGGAAVLMVEIVSVAVLVLVFAVTSGQFVRRRSRWWLPLAGTAIIMFTAVFAVAQTFEASR
jgi:hypothetical protein